MSVILAIFVFAFGTIIGSFLNVVILRYGTGRGFGGRSKCAVTGKTLEWYELIPIVSFVVQGGRTRHGGARISWQYPLVEFFTGAAFVAVVAKYLPLIYTAPQSFLINILFYFVVFSFLVLIFVYDWRHQIIPDNFVYPLWIICLIPIILRGAPVSQLLAGPIIAAPVFFLWYITRGHGMGFGDVKLLIPIGWLMGISAGFAGLLFAFWIGAIVGVAMMLGKEKGWHSEIPFGPFIIAGTVIVFLFNLDMSSIAHAFGSLI